MDYIWDTSGHHWKPHQLAEWQKRLAFVPDEAIKKTFIATTQLVPSIQHENELYPKDAQGARFPILSCRRLKEAVYCDIVKFPRITEKQTRLEMGLLFYCEKSKITAIYPLGYEESASKTLEYCFEFIRDFGCPTELHSDFANNLAKSNSWKRLAAMTLIRPHTNEANKSQSNYVERAWQDIQIRGKRIQAVHLVPKERQFDMYRYVCDVNNHTARKSLNWRTPMEALSGETPDISVLRFYFWEQVWYLNTPSQPKSNDNG